MLIEEHTFCQPEVIAELFAEQYGTVFLDSALQLQNIGQGMGSYSFIAIDPFLILLSKNGQIQIQERQQCSNLKDKSNVPKEFQVATRRPARMSSGAYSQYMSSESSRQQRSNLKAERYNPWDIIQQYLRKYKLVLNRAEYPDELPTFVGGAAGYFGYELHQHLENMPIAATDDLQAEDLFLGFYDLVISFNIPAKRMWLCSSGFPETTHDSQQQRALARIAWLRNIIMPICSAPPAPTVFNNAYHLCNTPLQLESNFSLDTYIAAINKAKKLILSGDIFQVNISQCFRAALPDDTNPFALYSNLRTINSAPFAAYINAGATTLLSASPERFIKLDPKNTVETCPIKGTIKRHADITADLAAQTALLNSVKDRAENVMIVDLMRNDLSKVCLPHSVIVPKLCDLQTFSHVHHLVSTIYGTLLPGKTAIDLLRATFPGGSVTGAPKIRAMEIISDIEQLQRAPYCGCIGYIGFDGYMDTSITIRTLVINKAQIFFHVGGAIVLDSDPHAEYEETLAKAKGLIHALSSIYPSP